MVVGREAAKDGGGNVATDFYSVPVAVLCDRTLCPRVQGIRIEGFVRVRVADRNTRESALRRLRSGPAQKF